MTQTKTIIITGAAGGIGAATAERFAREGYALTLADIDEKALHAIGERLTASYGSACLLCPGDLADLAYVRELVDRTLKRWSRVDVLVNNAAWRSLETMRTISEETWDKTLRICLTAPAFLSRWAAAAMEQRSLPGVIVNISSVMAGRAGGSSPAYIACKGGIESLTYELAALYGPRGIRVVAVSPGNIDTGLSKDYTDDAGNNVSDRLREDMNDHTALQRTGRPEEIAAVCWWLASSEASFVTGTILQADGGFLHNFNAYSMKKLNFPEEF